MDTKTYLNINKKDADSIVNDRGNAKDFYVLRFDTKTTYYNNDIVFKEYDKALEEFMSTKPNYKDERVELIFSPMDNDELYGENEMIMYKLLEE